MKRNFIVIALLSTSLLTVNASAEETKNTVSGYQSYSTNDLDPSASSVRAMHPGLFAMKKEYVTEKGVTDDRFDKVIGWFKEGFDNKNKKFDYFASE